MSETPGEDGAITDIKADLFKGIGHPARIRVLEILSAAPVSVSELRMRTGLEASNLSQHLGILRRHRLIAPSRRDGQQVYELTCPEVTELLASARILLSTVLLTTQQHLDRDPSQLRAVDAPEVELEELQTA